MFVAALFLYVVSLPSAPGMGDTAEYQASAYLLGIPHPTGFPLFMLLGWAFSHVVAFGTVAWRMNLLGALCTALTAAGVVLLAGKLGARISAAVLAGMTFAATAVVWRGAVHATPHSLAALFALAAVTAAVAFASARRSRLLFLAAACAGCGLATQPKVLFILPALLVAVWCGRAVMTRKIFVLACALLIAPLALYAYLPLRSAAVARAHLDPTAEAPLDGARSVVWDTHHPRTLSGFLDEVLGRDESAGSSLVQSFDPRRSVRAIAFTLEHERGAYNIVFLLLALAGTIALAQHNRRGLAVVIAGVVGGLMFASYYERDAEIERYFTLAYAVTAALAASATRVRIPRVPPRVVASVTTVALVLSFLATLASGRDLPGELRGSSVPPIIDAVLRDTPDGAIVVMEWQEGTAAAYSALIDRRFGTRTVQVAQFNEFADRLTSWARVRPVYLFSDLAGMADIATLPNTILEEHPSSYPLHHVYRVIPAR